MQCIPFLCKQIHFNFVRNICEELSWEIIFKFSFCSVPSNKKALLSSVPVMHAWVWNKELGLETWAVLLLTESFDLFLLIKYDDKISYKTAEIMHLVVLSLRNRLGNLPSWLRVVLSLTYTPYLVKEVFHMSRCKINFKKLNSFAVLVKTTLMSVFLIWKYCFTLSSFKKKSSKLLRLIFHLAIVQQTKDWNFGNLKE